MVYAPALKHAVGAVRSCLSSLGLRAQDERFAQHGDHRPAADAPLVLVACSGGRDSMALAAVSQKVCASLGLRCGAVIVDHHIQIESAQAARQAARDCLQLGLSPVVIHEVHVDESRGDGEEAAAREVRYQALASVAQWFDAAAVLLAHTLDDQAETVLMGLLRSGGTTSLAGMRRVIERYKTVLFARPLMELTRADTTSICELLNLSWWDDPTNGEHVPASEDLPVTFPLRSRVRHTLMPVIEQLFGSGAASHLAHGTAMAQADEDFLNASAVHLYEQLACREGETCVRLDAIGLANQPPAMRSRVVKLALEYLGVRFSARHVAAVEQLATHWHGQGQVSLPRGYSAKRKKHVIRVCKNGAHANR